MKRFHVHVHVSDLATNVNFYSKLFGVAPTKHRDDYAKWMLDDPRINFAISTRGSGATGVDHLGFQVDEAAELDELKVRGAAADIALRDDGETTCCYARSDKHWITDPQGIAWEQFHTLEDIPVFHETNDAAIAAADTGAQTSACCTPTPRGKPIGIAVKSQSACC